MSGSQAVAANERMFRALVSNADRRHDSRRPAGMIARLARVVSGEELDSINVHVRDVSIHGIGMRSPVRLEAGQIYRLEIGPPPGILIQVVHSRSRFDHTYDVGARAI